MHMEFFWKVTELSILSCLFLKTIHSKTSEITNFARQLEHFNDKIVTDHVLWKINTGRKLECIAKCARDIKCVSCFINTRTNLCQAHQYVFRVPTSASPSPGTRYFQIVGSECHTKQGYIHYRPLQFCYLLLEKYDWSTANKTCYSKEGHLVSVDSSEKQKYIENVLSSSKDFVGKGLFIGGNDIEKEGTFVNWDGKPLVYTNWIPNYPRANTIRDCICFNSISRKWANEDCSLVRPSICEYPNM